MAIRIELKIFETDNFDLQFMAKREIAETLNTIEYGTISKVAGWWVHIYLYNVSGENARKKDNEFI